jgi:hypothetical protein
MTRIIFAPSTTCSVISPNMQRQSDPAGQNLDCISREILPRLTAYDPFAVSSQAGPDVRAFRYERRIRTETPVPAPKVVCKISRQQGLIPIRDETDSPAVPPRHAEAGRHPRLLRGASKAWMVAHRPSPGHASATMTVKSRCEWVKPSADWC